jgi:hypothetical protein
VTGLQHITEFRDASIFVEYIVLFLRHKISFYGAHLPDTALFACIMYACDAFSFQHNWLHEDGIRQDLMPILRDMESVVRVTQHSDDEIGFMFVDRLCNPLKR